MKSNINKETITGLADRLFINLSDEETNEVLDTLNFIDGQFEKIDVIDGINNFEPLTQPFDLFTATMREDIPTDGESIENLLSNATHTEGREVEVPKVVG